MGDVEDDDVEFTCLTTKNKFRATNPDVVVLSNGRFAYKAPCPWLRGDGKQLTAFKFCIHQAHQRHSERTSTTNSKSDP